MKNILSFIHPIASTDEFSQEFLKSFIEKFKQDNLKIYIFITNSSDMDSISEKLASVTRDKRYVVLSKNELLFDIPEGFNDLHVNKLIILAISKYIRTKYYVLLTCKDLMQENLTYNNIIDEKKPECFSLFFTKTIQNYLKEKKFHLIDKEFFITLKKVSSYRGFYINMQKDTARDKYMQKQLKEFELSIYERFEALDGKELDRKFSTELDSGSLGRGFSHKGILEKNLDSDSHLHILEDDVVLYKYLPNTFDGIKDKIEWDIIYTDIYFSFLTPENFYIFNEKYKLYKEKGELSVINLKGIEFSGANSYFVNKKSIKKLNNHLSSDWYKHSKHDVYMNSLVQKGELKAFVIVPFVSTFSKHSLHSTINQNYNSTMSVMDSLKEAFYIEAQTKKILKKIEEVECSDMIKIYTNSTKVLLDNLDKKIDMKTIFQS